MRLLFLVVTASCWATPAPAPAPARSPAPDLKPDPTKFAAMTEDAKCKATAPRARACVDDLIAAQFAQAGGDQETTEGLSEVLHRDESSKDEAADVHRITCLGSPTYADAVFACWAKPDCKTFVQCVVEKDPIKR
jgi:hypothetical protein